MVNNAIDHSGGTRATVTVERFFPSTGWTIRFNTKSTVRTYNLLKSRKDEADE